MRYGQLISVYNNRLHIEILRNGIKWRTDIRDKELWLKESLKKGESLVTIEEDPSTTYETLISMMVSYGWVAPMINSAFNYITGQTIYLQDIHCNRCNTRLQPSSTTDYKEGIYCCPDCRKRNTKATVLPKLEIPYVK